MNEDRPFLQKRLQVEEPDESMSLHSRTAEFFESECRWSEAIEQYLSTRKHAEAARLVKRIGREFLRAGKWATVLRWVKSLPEPLRAEPETMLLQAQCLIYLGDAAGAVSLLTSLISKAGNNGLLIGTALSWRSAAFRLTGHLPEATRDIKASIKLLQHSDAPASALGDAYRRLGGIYADQGRFGLAIRYMKAALGQFSAVLDVGEMAEADNWLGIIYKRQGDLVKANVHFEQARAGWQRTGNLGALAMTLNNIAYIYQRRGQHGMALEMLDAGLDLTRQAGYRRVEALLLIARAEVLRDINRYAESMSCARKGLDLAREVMEPYYIVWAKANMAQNCRMLGDYDKARELLTEAIAQATEKGQMYEVALFTVEEGILQYEKGDLKGGLGLLEAAVSKLARFGDRDALARCYFHLSQAAFLSHNYDSALDFLKKCCAVADELGYDDFLAVEGKKARLLIEWAISKGIEKERLSAAADRVKRRRLASLASSSAGAAGCSEQPDIAARALGRVEVQVGAQPVAEAAWKSQRAKELFFYLLANPAGKTKEEIIADLWPEMPPSKATSNLHINLYRARHAVHPMAFVLEGMRYRVNPHLRVWLDANEFEECLACAWKSTEQGDSVTTELEHAISLYCGPFLSECYGEWAEAKRRALEGKLLKALYILAEKESRGGRHQKAAAMLERYISIEPYQEEPYYLLIEEYLAAGNGALASQAYNRYVEISRELGCAPSARMVELLYQPETAFLSAKPR